MSLDHLSIKLKVPILAVRAWVFRNRIRSECAPGLILNEGQAGSVIRDNGFIYVWGQTPIFNALQPKWRFQGTSGAIVFEDNFGPGLIEDGSFTGSLTTGASSSNVLNLTDEASTAAAITNPEPLLDVIFPQDLVACFVPLAAGTLLPSGKDVVGPVSANYDLERQTFNAARLSA